MAPSDLVFSAQLAERSERYGDMCHFMKEAIEKGLQIDLDPNYRSLLSVAYKNCVGQHRSAWRILNQIQEKERERKMDDGVACVGEMKAQVEAEIHHKCHELIHLVDSKCLRTGASENAQCFFWKLKGDYWRYLAEFPGPKRDEAIEEAQKAYTNARNIAAKALAEDDSLRIGVELNRAIFTYEILSKSDEAIKIAQDALAVCHQRRGDNYRESTVAMQLLKQNIDLWKANRS